MNIIKLEQLPPGSEQIIKLDQDSLTHLEVSLTSDADDNGLLYPLVGFTGDEITTNLTYQDILDDIAHTRKDNPRATLEAILGTYCMTSDGCETGLEFREDTPKKRWSSIFPSNFNEEANSLFNEGIFIKREQLKLVLDVAQASHKCSELLANADVVKDLTWDSADGYGDEAVGKLWKHVDECLNIGNLLIREICDRDDYT